MLTRLVLLAAICAVPSSALAQTIAPGTFQVSAITGLNTNRQTIETDKVGQGFQAGQLGFTSIIVGAEVSYFVTPKFSIGGTATFQRMSVDAPERDALAYLSGGYFGPLAQMRFALGNKSTFVFSGSFGGIRTTLTNRNTGFGEPIDSSGYGRYWLAGGGLSFTVTTNASFEAGVRYQSSKFGAPAGQQGEVTSSGLLVNLGFSLYFK